MPVLGCFNVIGAEIGPLQVAGVPVRGRLDDPRAQAQSHRSASWTAANALIQFRGN